MNPSTDFDRLLTSWLETAGPADVRSQVVDQALSQSQRVGQAGRLAGLLAGQATWPRHPWSPSLGRLAGSIRIVIVVGLLAALLAAAAWGSGAIRGLLHQPTSSPAPSATPIVGAPAYEAIYLRRSTGADNAIEVVAVRPSGEERLLRRLATSVPGSAFPLDTFGDVSADGWLAVSTTSSGQLPIAAFELVDLTDPGRTPIVVPYPPVIGGRWSSTDLFASSSAKPCPKSPGGFVGHTCWQSIDVLDPRTGSTTELGTIGLFGSGPSIVWGRDGSGILDADKIKPVDGGPDVPIDPGLLFDDRHVGKGGHVVCAGYISRPIPACAGAAPNTVRVLDLAGANAVDWYAGSPGQVVKDVAFAANGQGLWLTLDRTVDGHHRAVVVALDRPFNAREIASVDLPAGSNDPAISEIAPDDSQMMLSYWQGPTDNPQYVAALIVRSDGTTVTPPSGSFIGYVLGAHAESWPAQGDFASPAPSR